MPSKTIYFNDEQHDYIKSLMEEDGIHNLSQAVQYCVRQQQQREEL